ncbi:MAG: radical SAM protein [Deltaproteobacteria bacterium]|nr:radical SAM protein [Deltaproteobacteria bacterium]
MSDATPTLPSQPISPGPAIPQPGAHGPRRLTLEPPPQYAGAMVNVTNHCNLRCRHCFVFRDGNPNDAEGEMKPDRLLRELRRLRDRHGIRTMLWMGGEPMLRWRLIEVGLTLFQRNTITTNGTIALKDLGPNLTYVVSLDGPREVNDSVRGEGTFDKVMKTISAIPDGFRPTVMVQCVLHRENQHRLEELVQVLLPTPVQGLTFSFYVPRAGEVSARAWESNEEREEAVDIVFDLKRRFPGFIWNSSRSLELLRSAHCRLVTDNCPMQQTMLPLYIEGDHFTTPFCCYGNDVDCDRCGSWGVFSMAAKMGGPWDAAAD